MDDIFWQMYIIPMVTVFILRPFAPENSYHTWRTIWGVRPKDIFWAVIIGIIPGINIMSAIYIIGGSISDFLYTYLFSWPGWNKPIFNKRNTIKK